MKSLFLLGLGCCLAHAATNPPAVSFSRDVAPVLQRNCQTCHRPGEAAPFSLLTYQQARPWAKAMKEAVLLKKMPPWFADPHIGKFQNDRSMSQKDLETLVAWADAGAPEGDPADLPKPLTFVEGWNIGKPDYVVEMPNAFQVPASGTVEYQYLVIPTNFKEDRWIQRAEVRPGNRAVVHHVIAFIREPGSKWMKDAQPGIPFVPQKSKQEGGGEGSPGEALAGYAPGMPPALLAEGQALLVKAGSDIVLQLHYTANGKPGEDKTRIGLIFSPDKPKERVMSLAVLNRKFTIPPNDANYQVDSNLEINHEVKLVGMLPHMHLRGKDFEFRLVYPTGEKQTILRVPRYDFNWQLRYVPAEQILLPKGTKVECTAHFDNSRNNPSNPDPTKEVKWGDQSWEEMMIGFIQVAFDADMSPKQLFPERQKSATD